jgi:hypothetical protein
VRLSAEEREQIERQGGSPDPSSASASERRSTR